MYGTIARLHVSAGKEAEFAALTSRFGTTDEFPNPPGMAFDYAYQSDADPREFFIVVGFESREAYQANAQSPHQHHQFELLRALLDAEPEWHDGEVVFSFTQ